MSDVEIVTLIRTRLTRAGDGTKSNPIRIIEEYWDLEGKLVFEIDPRKEGQ